jgi:hypothetical protein
MIDDDRQVQMPYFLPGAYLIKKNVFKKSRVIWRSSDEKKEDNLTAKQPPI